MIYLPGTSHNDLPNDRTVADRTVASINGLR